MKQHSAQPFGKDSGEEAEPFVYLPRQSRPREVGSQEEQGVCGGQGTGLGSASIDFGKNAT